MCYTDVCVFTVAVFIHLDIVRANDFRPPEKRAKKAQWLRWRRRSWLIEKDIGDYFRSPDSRTIHRRGGGVGQKNADYQTSVRALPRRPRRHNGRRLNVFRVLSETNAVQPTISPTRRPIAEPIFTPSSQTPGPTNSSTQYTRVPVTSTTYILW